jgi:hypothetical protein
VLQLFNTTSAPFAATIGLFQSSYAMRGFITDVGKSMMANTIPSRKSVWRSLGSQGFANAALAGGLAEQVTPRPELY